MWHPQDEQNRRKNKFEREKRQKTKIPHRHWANKAHGG